MGRKAISASAKKRNRSESRKKYTNIMGTIYVSRKTRDKFNDLKGNQYSDAFMIDLLSVYEKQKDSKHPAKRSLLPEAKASKKQKISTPYDPEKLPPLLLSDISSVGVHSADSGMEGVRFIESDVSTKQSDLEKTILYGGNDPVCQSINISYGAQSVEPNWDDVIYDDDDDEYYEEEEDEDDSIQYSDSKADPDYILSDIPSDASIADFMDIHLEDPNIDMEGLNAIDVEELVLDIEVENTNDLVDDGVVPEPQRIHDPNDIVGKRFSLVMEENLLSLAKTKVPSVCIFPECKKPLDVKSKYVGTCCIIDWVCQDGHSSHSWRGQPTMRRVNGGDYMLACSILSSGNNYHKIKLLFDFLGCGCISQSSFTRIQRHYLLPCIKEYWENYNDRIIDSLEDREVIIMGDGRMDSPGHSAKFCTYTVMEKESGSIVACVVVDKREVQLKSTNMEKESLIRALRYLLDKGVKVVELVTDAHTQIAAYIRDHFPDIKHSFDVWHGSKNLSKKVIAVGSQKDNAILLAWSKDIVNHFWRSSKKAGGSVPVYLERWHGMLHHVTNNHEWFSGNNVGPGKCDHDPIDESTRTKPWFEKDSKPHQSLSQVILDKRFLNKIHYYVNFRHTGDIEAFQNHILMYAGKRFAFTFDGYQARCFLAAIDYNKHKDRPILKHKYSGETQYHRVWSKRNKQWVAHAKRETKKYEYINDLFTKMVRKRLDDTLSQSRSLTKAPGHPDLIAPTIASIPPPDTETLVQQHISRFDKKME